MPRRGEDPGPQWRRRTIFTGRAAVLALVVCALALSLAYPIQRYVAQRQQIAALQDEVAGRAQRVQALEEQQQRWRDPAFVRQEARRRLHFVMPGETGYVVIGPGGAEDGEGTAAGTVGSPGGPGGNGQPWYDRLRSSLDSAARAPADNGSLPAKGRAPASHIGPGKDAGGAAAGGDPGTRSGG